MKKLLAEIEKLRGSADADAPPAAVVDVGLVLGSGRFTISRKIGEGGMAEVWLAYDSDMKCEVAIKLPKTAAIADRMKQEVSADPTRNAPSNRPADSIVQ